MAAESDAELPVAACRTAEGGEDESDAADDELAGDDPEEGDDGAVTAVSEVAAVSAAVPVTATGCRRRFLLESPVAPSRDTAPCPASLAGCRGAADEDGSTAMSISATPSTGEAGEGGALKGLGMLPIGR